MTSWPIIRPILVMISTSVLIHTCIKILGFTEEKMPPCTLVDEYR
jgi:hypothetical protein